MSKKFTLREWRLTDKEALSENVSNINIWNNLRDSFPYPYTIEDGESFIKSVLEKPQPTVDFAIEIDGKVAGGIGVVIQSDVERISAELGYWLSEEYWNRGIMTDVIKEMVDYSFATLPVRKLYASVFDFNIASQKVLEKAGFQKEAVFKQHAVKNGKVIDLYYYSLIRQAVIDLLF